MRTPLSAPASARAIGLCCWLEQQMFMALGGRVVDLEDPEVKLTMLEVAEHAAWRTQRWYELLPTAPPGADVLVAAPPSVEALLAEIVDVLGAAPSAEVVLLAEALLILIDVLTGDLADRSAPLAGASVRRICGFARTDIAADLERIRDLTEADGGPPAGSADAGSALEPGSVLGRLRALSAEDLLALI